MKIFVAVIRLVFSGAGGIFLGYSWSSASSHQYQAATHWGIAGGMLLFLALGLWLDGMEREWRDTNRRLVNVEREVWTNPTVYHEVWAPRGIPLLNEDD